MERSQSCSSFTTASLTCDTNNNLHSNHSSETASPLHQLHRSAAATLHMRQALELRQTRLPPRQHSGSSDSLLQLTPFRRQEASSSPATLLRQPSTGFIVLDDIDYAADLDEEDEVLAERPHAHVLTHTMHRPHHHAYTPPSGGLRPYQQQFQRQQQQRQRLHTPLSQGESGAMLSHCHSLCTSSSASSTASSSASSALAIERRLKRDESFDSNSTNAELSPVSRRSRFGSLMRDNSIHSDSSRYSSVDSLLESRKPDPEAILINLGFGPIGSEDILSRIPKRFLKPSQVRGIDTEAFVKRLQLASNLADHSVLGYRGLTGNPDIPPSTIVAKIMQRFEVNERKKSMGSVEHTIR